MVVVLKPFNYKQNFNKILCFVVAISVPGETNKFKVQQNYFETTVHEQDPPTADFAGTNREVYEETWKGELCRRDRRYHH